MMLYHSVSRSMNTYIYTYKIFSLINI